MLVVMCSVGYGMHAGENVVLRGMINMVNICSTLKFKIVIATKTLVCSHCNYLF